MIDALPELVGVLLHDARGPLTAMSGWAQTLELAAHEPALVAEAASGLKAAVSDQSALLRLIEDLLSVARGLPLDREAIGLSELVADCCSAYGVQAAKACVRLESSDHASAIQVYGDPARLRCAIKSLIGEALLWSPPGGRLQLIVDSGANRLSARLRILDEGPALAGPTDLAFERTRRKNDKVRNSTDIDLHRAHARAVVEAAGGFVKTRNRLDALGVEQEIVFPTTFGSR